MTLFDINETAAPPQSSDLPTRWRPNTFNDLVGHEHITTILRNTVTLDRPAPAYLLAGSRGTGKTSTARIFARALLCDSPTDGSPCQTCQNCRGTAAGSHHGFRELDAASNRNLDAITQLIDDLRRTAATSPRQATIVDECHMLTNPAAASLSVHLEDPIPGHSYIMCTTEPQSLTASLSSRCLQLAFTRVSNPDIARRVSHICASERIAIDSISLTLLTNGSHGSLRDACKTLDYMALATGNNITSVDMELHLGSSYRQPALIIASNLLRDDPTSAARTIAATAWQGASPTEIHQLTLEQLDVALAIAWNCHHDLGLSETTIRALTGHDWQHVHDIINGWAAARPPARSTDPDQLQTAAYQISESTPTRP